MSSLIETYSGNGIYISWDWSNTAVTGTSMQISRSDYGSGGPWTVIDTVDYPEYDYIDYDGNLASYYKLEEVLLSVVQYTHPVIWGEEALLRADVFYEIKWLQNLRVYRERLMPNRERTQWRSEVAGWNLDPSPEIWIGAKDDESTGGMQILSQIDAITDTTETANPDYPDGLKYSLDYNGKVYFWDSNDAAAAIQSYDDILATFSFKLFSNHQINEALKRSLYSLVSQPGICKISSLGNAPLTWDHAIIVGAMAILMRQVQNMLLSPQGALLLSIDPRDPETVEKGRDSLITKFADMAKDYRDEFDKLKEKIAIERYPGLYIIATPEFMLPGGRSSLFRNLMKGS